MVRPLRLLVPGGVYHVTARGNARGDVFYDDYDRVMFLDVFAHVVDRFGWVCHAYCLMGNHYHQLIETPQPNLSIGMRQLNGVYAQRFNRRHRRVGHLFQARFKAVLVEREAHLLEAARYVVLNPVRAGIAERPEDWPWSSYLATAGLEACPAFLTVSSLLDRFVGAPDPHLAYQQFVAQGIGLEPPRPLGDIYLGNRAFASTQAPNERVEEVPRRQWHPVVPTLDEIFSHNGDSAPAIAYRQFGYSLKQIADHLGVHYATISRRLGALDEHPLRAPRPDRQRRATSSLKRYARSAPFGSEPRTDWGLISRVMRHCKT